MPHRHRLSPLLRLLALTGALLAGTAHADAYSDVAALAKSGKTVQALEKAEQYLAGNPRDPQMRFLKGVTQSQSGATEAAIATFSLLIEEYPELPEPYNNLAVLYAANNDLDKARGALETAVRNNPNYAVAHENLGDIYARLAHDAYARSLKINGANRPLQLKLSTLTGLLRPVAR